MPRSSTDRSVWAAVLGPVVLLVVLLPALVGCSGAPAPAEPASSLELFVLGTAQDGGLPHFGCNRACCETARASGRALYPACLGVVEHDSGELLLVEATPAVEQQVAMLQQLADTPDRGRRPVDAVMLTHAHIGHYLGLAFFGREVASTKAMPTWCSPRMAGFLRGHGPWQQLVELGQLELREVAERTEFEPLPGLFVTAIAVPHRDEFSDTMAYKLRGPNRTVLFVPDIDSWARAETLLKELLADVDVAYLDATFYDGRELPERNLAEIRHPLMIDTMDRLAEEAQARPGSLRFIHLNHTNPALHDEQIRAEVRARGFAIAEQGESVVL
ncbi:MAG: MBL fold metallo-hydrolase [Planctomycetota bacterium]|nr:MBL fold metallo-hydrolase [Planctomycetota bacterium]